MSKGKGDTVRIVHLDADGFGDVSLEQAVFAAALEAMVFETATTDDPDWPTTLGAADILLTHYTEIDEAAMRAIGPEVIVRYATGVDGVDVEAATRLGIRVVRIPEYCDAEVADHVLALALALWRRLPQYNAHVARGVWDGRSAEPGAPFHEAVFGFLGFGRKARAAAARARALGCRILAYDPHVAVDQIIAAGADAVSFEELLEGVHILSVHAPLTPETDHLLDAPALAKLPAGAILINTARGRIIDEAALRDALDEGRLSGAGLDVLSTEPPSDDHPLVGRHDVIITPHAAWYSSAAERRCRELGSRYAIEALRGIACDGLVNPDVLQTTA